MGRPNVGKSALFNRLLQRKEALVYNTPGGHVTRDYQEGVGSLGDLRFKALDTSGLEPSMRGGSIQARAAELTARVLQRADIALLLIDGRCVGRDKEGASPGTCPASFCWASSLLPFASWQCPAGRSLLFVGQLVGLVGSV